MANTFLKHPSLLMASKSKLQVINIINNSTKHCKTKVNCIPVLLYALSLVTSPNPNPIIMLLNQDLNMPHLPGGWIV